MSGLIITHKIAAPLEVLPADLGLKGQTLTTAATVLNVTDDLTFQTANKILVDMQTASKAIEAKRVELKGPINQLAKEIERVVASVADPLDVAKRSLQAKVVAYQRAEAEKVAKAQREADEKARIEREAAEKERIRLQLEADEKAKAEAAELEAVLGKPVEVERVIVPPVAVPEPTRVIAKPAPIASAVQTRKVPTLEVTDPIAFLSYIVQHKMLDLVLFNMPEIKKSHEAGVPLPGVTAGTKEVLASART